MELQVVREHQIAKTDVQSIDKKVDEIIAINKGKSKEMQELVLEGVSALTAADARSAGLAKQGFFQRIWGGITGENNRVQNDINQQYSCSLYASQRLIQKVAEQNLMSLQMIQAVNDKLNSIDLKHEKYSIEVKERINAVKSELLDFFEQLKERIDRLENKVDINQQESERRYNVLQLCNTFFVREYQGRIIGELGEIEQVYVLAKLMHEITAELSGEERLNVKAVLRQIKINGMIRNLEPLILPDNDVPIYYKLEASYRNEGDGDSMVDSIIDAFNLDKYENSFRKIEDINYKYNLDNTEIIEFINNKANLKVCLPIIGRFSSGKSALMNALLQKKNMLREAITPETAVPTEIVATVGEDCAELYDEQGNCNSVTIKEYRQYDVIANKVKYARVKLCNNSLLPSIPDLMLVDMPGLESGNISHNMVIDLYLPKSMGYIITFAAEDMTLKNSILDVLRELIINEMPICIAITKSDKVTAEILQANLKKLQADLEKYFSGYEFIYAITSSKNNEVDSVKAFLLQVQNRAKNMLEKKWEFMLSTTANSSLDFLRTTKDGVCITNEELAEKEENLTREFESFEKKVTTESEQFLVKIPEIAQGIKNDIHSALDADVETYVSMAMNGQDVGERLNAKVRSSLAASMKKRFDGKMKIYLEKMASLSNISVDSNMNLSIYCDESGEAGVNVNNIANGISIGTTIATLAGFVISPTITIVTVFAKLIGKLFEKSGSEKQHDDFQQRNQIRSRLTGEIIPNAVEEIGNKVDSILQEKVEGISGETQEKLQNKRAVLQKALDDVRAKKTESEDKQRLYLKQLEEDINCLEAIIDGI